ncbi:hypothetical protein BC938DRAFT_473812 [Jimgerdemannia flammicorona]|uniref:Uncharacterized protein n=1 Tax=Jimgerdemannia flammicorona TaxID=994334 RepID=A0A433Q3G7_9FUNG|nr:hypothetical protein BC938DRAFT_473812 [Jimgerdemannia flammicorona]
MQRRRVIWGCESPPPFPPPPFVAAAWNYLGIVLDLSSIPENDRVERMPATAKAMRRRQTTDQLGCLRWTTRGGQGPSLNLDWVRECIRLCEQGEWCALRYPRICAGRLARGCRESRILFENI